VSAGDPDDQPYMYTGAKTVVLMVVMMTGGDPKATDLPGIQGDPDAGEIGPIREMNGEQIFHNAGAVHRSIRTWRVLRTRVCRLNKFRSVFDSTTNIF